EEPARDDEEGTGVAEPDGAVEGVSVAASDAATARHADSERINPTVSHFMPSRLEAGPPPFPLDLGPISKSAAPQEHLGQAAFYPCPIAAGRTVHDIPSRKPRERRAGGSRRATVGPAPGAACAGLARAPVRVPIDAGRPSHENGRAQHDALALLDVQRLGAD